MRPWARLEESQNDWKGWRSHHAAAPESEANRASEPLARTVLAQIRRGTHASASRRIPNRTTALATMCPALESPRYGSRKAARSPRNTTATQARWAQNKRPLKQILSIRPQCGRAEAEEDCKGNNSGGSEGAKQRSDMGNAGEQCAVEGQDRGKEIETSQQMARQAKKRLS
jgi:hypothetical protein